MASKAELQAKADELKKELAAAEAAAADAPTTPSDPIELFHELLTAIVSHMGNPPRIENLLKAFISKGTAEAPTSPAPTPPPEPTPQPITLPPHSASN
jgi:hypothetical protein